MSCKYCEADALEPCKQCGAVLADEIKDLRSRLDESQKEIAALRANRDLGKAGESWARDDYEKLCRDVLRQGEIIEALESRLHKIREWLGEERWALINDDAVEKQLPCTHQAWEMDETGLRCVDCGAPV